MRASTAGPGQPSGLVRNTTGWSCSCSQRCLTVWRQNWSCLLPTEGCPSLFWSQLEWPLQHFILIVCYRSMQHWQSIIHNAQAGSVGCLKGEGVPEVLLVLQLPAGSRACVVGKYLSDCCWRAEQTSLLFVPCSASDI